MALDPKDNGSQDPHANDAAEHREDIGGSGSSDKSHKNDGGSHHTVYDEDGYRYSWDTNADGSTDGKSAHDNPNNSDKKR